MKLTNFLITNWLFFFLKKREYLPKLVDGWGQKPHVSAKGTCEFESRSIT
jgi:hypothetical protein